MIYKTAIYKTIIHYSRFVIHSRKGQSLIELLVAIGLAMVILPALLTGFVASREGKAQEGQRLQATALMKEMEEAVRSVREKGWNNISTDGTYYPVAGSDWSLTSGTESINGTDFTRALTISSVYRDASGNIAGSGTIDPSTKKVDYAVNWTQPNPGSITSSEYLQRYIGNTTKSNSTVAEFTNGAILNNTEVVDVGSGDGTVRLKSAISSFSWIDDYLAADSANYNFDSAKIEMVGGFAQLKNLGGGSSGQTLNPTVNSNANNWTFVLYGDNSGQSGKWNNSGGNPQGNLGVAYLKRKNQVSGGYWYQAFTTASAGSTGTLAFDWSVKTYAATPDSFHIYAWIDTGLGTPATVIWDSGNITSTTSWATVSLNVSSYMSASRTYYVKFGAYLDYPSSNTGGFAVSFDNMLLSWTGGASYASDSPTIYPKSSFTPASVTGWTHFTATEVPNGGSVRYQLSDDNGATWKYWNGSAWTTASLPTNYNTAAQIETNIPTFPITAGRILVRAFLIGTGTQQVKLDKIQIDYTGTGSGSNSGTYTQVMDAGASVAFNRIIWNPASQPAGTTASLQIATSPDNVTYSSYVTPDANGGIPLSDIIGRYLKYQVSFNSTNANLPAITDVTVNYSP